ncbi:hypothetical protein M422DRAFT_265388 [Sphaerobolus stellatus SS14]|uniref:JmjC domain-containing protein n=1 Tax=Sphaerobolus stellatus (strain SS14) TaxID=990650 RepID=A0A0C9V5S9_SPHS4|nr:hypothetical protein M422DRAFT_265388 [Sphaerobolus stellatus SS14]
MALDGKARPQHRSKGLGIQSDSDQLYFVPYNVTLARVVNATFGIPAALSQRTIMSEKAMWKCLTSMLAQIMPLSQSTGIQHSQPADLVQMLTMEMQKVSGHPRTPAVHTTITWPHMGDVPARIEVPPTSDPTNFGQMITTTLHSSTASDLPPISTLASSNHPASASAALTHTMNTKQQVTTITDAATPTQPDVSVSVASSAEIRVAEQLNVDAPTPWSAAGGQQGLIADTQLKVDVLESGGVDTAGGGSVQDSDVAKPLKDNTLETVAGGQQGLGAAQQPNANTLESSGVEAASAPSPPTPQDMDPVPSSLISPTSPSQSIYPTLPLPSELAFNHFEGSLSPITVDDEDNIISDKSPSRPDGESQPAQDLATVVMVPTSTSKVQQAQDALRRSMRIRGQPIPPPNYPSSLNTTKLRQGKGGKGKKAEEEHRGSSKRNIDQVDGSGNFQSKQARSETPCWKTQGSGYIMVPSVQGLIPYVEKVQVPSKEPPTYKSGEDKVANLKLIRHVLLEDGKFHKELVNFNLHWPAGTDSDRQMFWSLYKRARPATVEEITSWPVVDDIKATKQQLFHTPDCLNKSKVTISDLKHCEERLATCPCLILRPRTREEIDGAYDSPLEARDIALNLGINVHLKREAHDLRCFDPYDVSKHMITTSIVDVLCFKRQAINVFDIPNSSYVRMPRFIQRVSLDSSSGQLATGPGFPHEDTKWNLFATAPALTRLHYNAGKFCTWIEVQQGAKIWFIMDGEIPPEGMAEIDITKHTFVYFVVEPGGILTIPPAIPHAVLNVTDCVAQGGHYYLLSALEASFKVGLREHASGNKDTNTTHIASENILHSILASYYLDVIVLHPGIVDEDNETEPVPYEYLQTNIDRFPSPAQMACLISMTVHALAFEPAMMEEAVEGYECPVAIFDMRGISRARAIRLLDCFPELRDPIRSCEEHISDILKNTSLEEHYVPLVPSGV